MPARPDNHVTRAQQQAREAAFRSSTAAWPEIPEELAVFLAETFPARCYDHRSESLEDHLLYAGKVSLAETIRDALGPDVREARLPDEPPASPAGQDLDILTGSAEDLSVFRSEKTADLNFVQNTFNAAARRVGAAFLLDSASRREGERVTAEEVQRVGRELDQAMGGLYTQQGQGNQRRIVMRAIRLHEEENENFPPLPKGVVSVNVVTGKDSMGRSSEVQALTLFAQTLNQLVGPQGVAQILKAGNFATRLAAGLGVKPDGLVKTQQQVNQEQSQAKQEAMAGTVLDKAAGPMAGALAAKLAGSIPPPATETRQ